jgi:hypothetical protein
MRRLANAFTALRLVRRPITIHSGAANAAVPEASAAATPAAAAPAPVAAPTESAPLSVHPKRTPLTARSLETPVPASPASHTDGKKRSFPWAIMGVVMGSAVLGAASGFLTPEEEAKPIFDRAAIEEDLAQNFRFRPDIAPSMIRLALVFCVARAAEAAKSSSDPAEREAAQRAVESLRDPALRVCASFTGLDDAINVLSFMTIRWTLSLQDLSALSLAPAVRFLENGAQPSAADSVFRYGRRDTVLSNADLRRAMGDTEGRPITGPVPFAAPSAKDDKAKVPPAESLRLLVPSLTDAELVALMASHATGELHSEVSGVGVDTYVRPSRSAYLMGPNYYRTLLRLDSRFGPVFTPPRTRANEDVPVIPEVVVADTSVILPASGKKVQRTCAMTASERDMLLRDPKLRVHVERFAARSDEARAEWAAACSAALRKLSEAWCEPGTQREVVVPTQTGPTAPAVAGAPAKVTVDIKAVPKL